MARRGASIRGRAARPGSLALLRATPAWLILGAVALGAGLAGTLFDLRAGVYGPTTPQITGGHVLFTLALGLGYGWWALSLAEARTNGKAWLPSLIALELGWSLLANAFSALAPCAGCSGAAPYQDLGHIAGLIFGVWAAAAGALAYRLIPGSRAPGPLAVAGGILALLLLGGLLTIAR